MVVRMPSNLQELLLRSRGEAFDCSNLHQGRCSDCLHGQLGVLSCCVRDVTNVGVGICLNNLRIVPLDFELSSDNFHIRNCHLLWRNDDFTGVKFRHLTTPERPRRQPPMRLT
jgi:hypothetical protein